ncbi:hypothetical protein GUJ93_ZPchr0013g36614 [Zizania palustris]|uniref:Pentatricopeptide repeat-containing protein n=1 Tax=Zizania palustris TaxID=103762 RepID=A0A8J5X3X9_ZIZPA|nr:hypothetical protein GUJ93_ZPchr0013g36614 [Zizania palustris]
MKGGKQYGSFGAVTLERKVNLSKTQKKIMPKVDYVTELDGNCSSGHVVDPLGTDSAKNALLRVKLPDGNWSLVFLRKGLEACKLQWRRRSPSRSAALSPESDLAALLNALHGARELHHPRFLPIAILVLARVGCLADASALLDSAPGHNDSAYTALVSGLAGSGAQSRCPTAWTLYKEAAQVFDEMTARFQPDKVTFNSLLDVHGKAQRHDDAIEVIVETVHVVCPPSVLTYNSLISSYVKDRMLEETIELKQEMKLKQIKPDVVTYTTQISALDRGG